MKMVKCLPEIEYFYCILENRNFISKIRISKVTDYAALMNLSGSIGVNVTLHQRVFGS